MKKYIFGSLLLGALVSSCNLDETPASAFSQDEAMKSETLIYVNTVAAVYNQMGAQFATDVNDASEYLSDELMFPGRLGDWIDGGIPQNRFTHNLNAGQGNWNSVWNNNYAGIAKANAAIATLEQYADKVSAAADYMNELRAYRALIYYNLMDLFGNIPVVTRPDQSTAETTPTKRAEVFKWIWNELDETLPTLNKAHSPNSGAYFSRMTQGVALMTLAKMAQNAPFFQTDPSQANWSKDYMGTDMTGAETVSESIGANITAKMKEINLKVGNFSGNALETTIYLVDELEKQGYKLSVNYTDNFKVKNEGSEENILTIANDSETYQRSVDHHVRSWHYNHAGHSHYRGFGGWNGPCATVFLAKKYGYTQDRQDLSTVDPRFQMNFYIDRDYAEETGERVTDGKNEGVNPATSELALEYMPLHARIDYSEAEAAVKKQKGGVYASFTDEEYFQHVVKCGGARYKKYEFDYSATNHYAPDNDIVIWRFADAKLMRAEANYRLGKKDLALNELNEIRLRAGAAPVNDINLQIISDERLMELAWEGVRRLDQIRFATLNEPNEDRYVGVAVNGQAAPYKIMDGHTYALPIPASQMSLNSNLVQNWGY